MSCTFVDEATEATLLNLPGAVAFSHNFPGSLTTHAMADGSVLTDGRVIEPETLTISGKLSTTSLGSTPEDPARIRRTLEQIRQAGTRVSVQFPDWSAFRMMVGSWVVDGDETQDPGFTINLGEAQLASSSRVSVEALPGANPGPPRPDVAAGLASTNERGTVPTSLAASLANSADAGLGGLVNLLPGGI